MLVRYDTNYSLFYIKKCILQRSEKGAFTPICTHTKLENQLKYGANVCTVSELAKQWVLLSARPFSKLYRGNFMKDYID